jgi:DNA processing protein
VTAPTSPSQPQSVQDAPEHYGAERASRSESPIEDALRALLRLANLQFSARLTLALLEHFAWDAERLFDASDAELDAIPAMQARHIVRLRDPAMQVTDRQWHWIEKREVRLVLLPEENYPRALREIHDPPPLLFVRGTLAETDRFGVGMVGSRHATPYGRSVAEKLARELAGRGLTVVSGGAVGIDAAAHRGALAGGGRTLAVLGCGLDVDYPRDHRALFEQIASQGALISEYPLGAQPEAWRFPLPKSLYPV